MNWLDVVAKLGPLAVAVSALLVFLIGVLTWRQKSTADSRSEWWRRTQWAIEQTFEQDEARKAIGYELLGVLADSPLAGPEEAQVLEILVNTELEPLEPPPS